ncbi:MAG: thioesterase domain-containing protein [Reinekea sp.]
MLCFPYAGGDWTIYRNWQPFFDDSVEVVPIGLKGRGRMINQPPLTSWVELINDLWDTIEPYLHEPHIFFGHSFGGRIAYELAHKCRTINNHNTRLLMISACRSPNYPQKQPYMHKLADDRFLEAIQRMSGTPAVALKNKSLTDLMLPSLRADMKLAEIWHARSSRKVNVPIAAFYGSHDLIESVDSIAGWREFTTAGFSMQETSGGHFYINDNQKMFTDLIKRTLQNYETN